MTRAQTKEPEPAPDLLDNVAPPVAKPAKKNQVAKIAVQAMTANGAPPNLLAAIIQAAADPACNPDKLHALLDARDRLMREQAHVEFMGAYIQLQSRLPRINKDGILDQGTTKSGRQGAKARYATYENINASTKDILAEERFGLLLLPDVGADGTGIIIRGQLAYVCETQYGKIVHVERCTIAVPPEASGGKNAAQGVGSSLSYGKRFGAIALLNLVSFAGPDRDTDAKKVEPPQETVLINSKQIAELNAAIKDCGVDVDTVLNHYKVEKLDDLPVSSLTDALQACARFKANKVKPNG